MTKSSLIDSNNTVISFRVSNPTTTYITAVLLHARNQLVGILDYNHINLMKVNDFSLSYNYIKVCEI